jgi:2-polyprenyl-3-methyl-5-hydroxy-6-metoxy-1,4-benzoquinol methylase
MAEDSGQSALGSLFSHILPLVPGIAKRLEEGIDVLDLGCGRGKILAELAARYPSSRFVGYDLSEEAIAYARAQAEMRDLHNLRFEVRDLSDFDTSADIGAFDFVTTFDAVHDQAKPLALLKGIRRTLRDGGVYLMQDIAASSHVEKNAGHPLGTLIYTISTMHCMTVSLAQGGDGLGAAWGRELAQTMLREAGFGTIAIHQLAHDVQNEYYVMKV